MRVWPDVAARVAVGAMASGALLVAIGLLDLASTRDLGVLLLVLGFAFLGLTRWSRRYWRRVVPVYDEEFPGAGRVHVRADGSFDWRPPATSQIGVRHGLVHRWWDAERGAKFSASIQFDIPDEVAPDVLARATTRSLKAATRALPARGKVRAKGAHRDEAGPTALVSVTLYVQGVGATPEWARLAAEEFARAFLRTLKSDGFLADRR